MVKSKAERISDTFAFLLGAVVVLFMARVFYIATVRTAAGAHCLRAGYPTTKVSFLTAETYCIKRTNNEDKAVPLSEVKK